MRKMDIRMNSQNPLNSLRFLSSMIYDILENNQNLTFNEKLNIQIISIALTMITDKILPKLLGNNPDMVKVFQELESILTQFEKTLNTLNSVNTVKDVGKVEAKEFAREADRK